MNESFYENETIFASQLSKYIELKFSETFASLNIFRDAFNHWMVFLHLIRAWHELRYIIRGHRSCVNNYHVTRFSVGPSNGYFSIFRAPPFKLDSQKYYLLINSRQNKRLHVILWSSLQNICLSLLFIWRHSTNWNGFIVAKSSTRNAISNNF